MTELVGGDYVLSAGQDLQYVFTRVLINQHRLEGQACTPCPAPPSLHAPVQPINPRPPTLP